MNIAMVNTARARGGAARTASTLATALSRHSRCRVVFYHGEDDRVEAPFHGLRRPASHQLNALLARIGGTSACADLGLANELIRLTERADILHLHNAHGYYLDYPKLMQAWRNRPIVWTWHDMWGATGRCASAANCQQWKAGCAPCPQPRAYPAAWVDWAARDYPGKRQLLLSLRRLWIVSPSAWLGDIARNCGFAPDRILTIPNPVDISQFRAIEKHEARQRLGLPDGFIALFIASDCNDEQKGYRDFSRLIHRHAAIGIAVGSPPRSPAPGVQHTGRITSLELLNLYYAAADLMVIPSYFDNYPNTVIEAMASGTPVLGYATGGIPSQLQGASGCGVVATGDLSALEEWFANCRARGGKTGESTQTLAALAASRWDAAVIAERYVALYERAGEEIAHA